jgi:hypothetical protein
MSVDEIPVHRNIRKSEVDRRCCARNQFNNKRAERLKECPVPCELFDSLSITSLYTLGPFANLWESNEPSSNRCFGAKGGLLNPETDFNSAMFKAFERPGLDAAAEAARDGRVLLDDELATVRKNLMLLLDKYAFIPFGLLWKVYDETFGRLDFEALSARTPGNGKISGIGAVVRELQTRCGGVNFVELRANASAPRSTTYLSGEIGQRGADEGQSTFHDEVHSPHKHAFLNRAT